MFERRFQRAQRVLAQCPLPRWPLFHPSLSLRMLSPHICPSEACCVQGSGAWRSHGFPITSPRIAAHVSGTAQSLGNRVSIQTLPPRSHISERRPEETQLERLCAAATSVAPARTTVPLPSVSSWCYLPLAQSFSAGKGLTSSSELSSFVLGCGNYSLSPRNWTVLSVNRGCRVTEIPASHFPDGGPRTVT